MNKLKDNDLREALRRRESKRKPAEVPADFLDNVMREVNTEKARPRVKIWHMAVTSLAAAACIAIAVMLTLPKAQPLPSQLQPPVQASSPQRQKEEAAPVLQTSLQSARSRIIISTEQNHIPDAPELYSPSSKPAAPSAADSLNYYISKVEQSLADIRDSCYQVNVERLIRADAHLQRLVNQLILDGMLADTVRIAAM